MICRFIAEHRDQFGVVPICRVLTEHGCTIAPRTFYAWLSRPLSRRALWDASITAVLASYCVERDEHGRRRPESLYGSLKMWAHLRCQGIEVAVAPWNGSWLRTVGAAPPGRRRSTPLSRIRRPGGRPRSPTVALDT
ncbi:MAG: hypothetical protein EOP32_25480 [Rhodococcus sp. (in: high G+C Gram-positive bacteria)]|nr:MAG: hypothetical protein EOP32_25480 [Rhodococcus sp. (in: high G+C Gram-positive bacteria)]